jgi:Methyltransferase domain
MLIKRVREAGPANVVRFAVRLAEVAVRRPSDAVDHLSVQLALTRDRSPRLATVATSEWRRVLHERIDAAWPCKHRREFNELWASLSFADPATASSPVTVNHDADPALAEMVWCLARHLRPRVAIETGVSRGITSRVILEAFARNGEGHLWSIDLPPLGDPWRHLVGTAVPPTMRERWTYIRGASRRRLPDLCRRVGPIEMFVHDSLHTPDNLHFELATIWPRLRPSAAVVIDDVEDCKAVEVVQRFARTPLVCASEERKRTSAGFTFNA